MTCCICVSASLDSSPKRMPTLAECFMNFVQHDWTHCTHHWVQQTRSMQMGEQRARLLRGFAISVVEGQTPHRHTAHCPTATSTAQ